MSNVPHDSGSDDEDTEIEKTYTKGPWTLAEDNLLQAYIDKHGDRKWKHVQKHSGLSRCDKSIRHRWVNHLRPNLKKGGFTEEEKQRVIELHAAMGNKWSLMSKQLPGRTDSDIKNHWNTRLRRLKQLGLPVYPDEVREQAIINAAAQEIEATWAVHSSSAEHNSDFQYQSGDLGTLQYNQMPTLESENILVQSSLTNQTPSSSTFSEELLEPSGEKRATLTDSDALLLQSDPLIELTIACVNTTGYNSNFQDKPGNWGTQQYNQMPTLESENSLVQSTLTNQTPSSSTFSEELLEPSGEKRATLADSDSLLFQFDPLTELTLASANTTGYNSNFQDTPGDWGTQLYNQVPTLESENIFVQSPLTNQTPSSSTFSEELLEPSGQRRATLTDSDSLLLQSDPLTELTLACANTKGYNSNFQDKPGNWGTQLYNQVPTLESENIFVQSPLSNQRPSSSTFSEELLEPSGEKRVTHTDSDSPLLQSDPLTELTLACANTTGHSSIFQDKPGDWGTQKYNQMPALESENILVESPLTDQTPSSTFSEELLEPSKEKRATHTDSDSPLLQSDPLTELTLACGNTTGYNSNFQNSFSSNEKSTSSFKGD